MPTWAGADDKNTIEKMAKYHRIDRETQESIGFRAIGSNLSGTNRSVGSSWEKSVPELGTPMCAHPPIARVNHADQPWTLFAPAKASTI